MSFYRWPSLEASLRRQRPVRAPGGYMPIIRLSEVGPLNNQSLQLLQVGCLGDRPRGNCVHRSWLETPSEFTHVRREGSRLAGVAGMTQASAGPKMTSSWAGINSSIRRAWPWVRQVSLASVNLQRLISLVLYLSILTSTLLITFPVSSVFVWQGHGQILEHLRVLSSHSFLSPYSFWSLYHSKGGFEVATESSTSFKFSYWLPFIEYCYKLYTGLIVLHRLLYYSLEQSCEVGTVIS